MNFYDFADRVRRSRGSAHGISELPQKILALDPGETMGWATFNMPLRKIISGQSVMTVNRAHEIDELIHIAQPDLVVMEDYKVYAWKAKEHSWADLFTPKLIGAIDYVTERLSIPLVMQMAQTAKPFCTNDRLKQWGLYNTAKKHANDAIRHGAYYILFGKVDPK